MNQAWQSFARVNAGDYPAGARIRVLPGNYREQLRPGRPARIEAFDRRDRPVLWGSDVLPGTWSASGIGADCYEQAHAVTVNWLLVDHVFLARTTSTASCAATPDSWYWSGGTLYVHVAANPNTDGREYTACVREDVIHSNALSNVTFSGLVVRESAKYAGGYGVRVEGGDRVTLEDLNISGCGTHAIGAIATDNFRAERCVGYNLAPGQGSGGATTFVSYASSGARVHEWVDCESDTGDDSVYPAFTTHGSGILSVLVQGLTANGYGVAVTSDLVPEARITIQGGTFTNSLNIIEGTGTVVDGARFSGPNTVLYVAGENCVARNCVCDGTIMPHWQGSRPGAIVDEGIGSLIEDNDIQIDRGPGACIALRGDNAGSTWRRNRLRNASGGPVFRALVAAPDDLSSDENVFLDAEPMFETGTLQNVSLTRAQWQALGYDQNSTFGGP